MELAPPSRNQEIVDEPAPLSAAKVQRDELRREMARMAEHLAYDVEPAVTFILKASDDRP